MLEPDALSLGMHSGDMGMLGVRGMQPGSERVLDPHDPVVQHQLLQLQHGGYIPDVVYMQQSGEKSGSQTFSARTSAIDKSLAAGTSVSSMGPSSMQSRSSHSHESETPSESWR